MTKKPLLIAPMALILYSTVESLYTLYSGPSRYASRDLSHIWWPHTFPILVAVYFAKKVKAKYWGVSIIAVALTEFPRALIPVFPAYTHILVVATMALAAISTAALLAACRYDTFDLGLFEKGHASGPSYLTKIIIALVMMAGIFLYFGRK